LSIGLTLTACDIDVPDLNNPGLDDLENNPTPSKVAAAATGMLIQNRAGIGAENGYVTQLGILGREAYNFDSADPRYVGELLEGPLSAGSPFGGAFWPGSYSDIRNGNILLHALDKVEGLTDEQLSGFRGFAHTIMALDLLIVINTHDTNGIVVDADNPIDGPLGEIVDKPTGMAAIVSLLDGAVAELQGAGDAFAFNLSSGFAGFDDPAGFLKFNRALRARVAIYNADYAGALTALGGSFIDDTATADLNAGVFYVFGTSSGDTANSLINPNIYAHPSLQTDAQMKTGGMPDDRFTNKVTTADKPGSGQDHMSTLAFTLYTAPNSPIPLIRNEELILIKAEALKNTGDLPGAIVDLNFIRTTSGGLPARADITAANFDDELLYNRRYSLMFEGGHRWIDVRRFNRETDLPLDLPTDVRNVRFPIPLNECNARPGEPRCALGSQ
jgi:hypothetical protein